MRKVTCVCRGEAAARSWAIKDELAAPDTRPAVIIMSEVIYNQSGDSLYDDDFHDTLVRSFCVSFTILWFVAFVFSPL